MSFIYPVAFFDPPQVLDASVTNIPGSASLPLQVVASTPLLINAIDYIDGIGTYIGVYIGAPGSEVLKCIIGGGLSTRAWVVIPVNSRISLRSMTPATINGGTLFCAFMGYK